MLFVESDTTGAFNKYDSFSWVILNTNLKPIYEFQFNPILGEPAKRQIELFNHTTVKGSTTNISINEREIYNFSIQVNSVQNGDRLIAELSTELSSFKLVDTLLPYCTIPKIRTVAAKWKINNGTLNPNGIVTNFGNNYLAFDNIKYETNPVTYSNPICNNLNSLELVEQNITIKKPKVFDHELNDQLLYEVQVSDGVLSDTAVIKIIITDDRAEDFDRDGLIESQEEDLYGSSDIIFDTDGDGYSDSVEVGEGTDPIDSLSFPNLPLEINIDHDIEQITLTWRRGILQFSSNFKKNNWMDVILPNDNGRHVKSPYRIKKNKYTQLFRVREE